MKIVLHCNNDFSSLVRSLTVLRDQAAGLCAPEVADAAAALVVAAKQECRAACDAHYDALKRNAAALSLADVSRLAE